MLNKYLSKIIYKDNIFYLSSFVFFVLLSIFIYRSLLFNLSTNLLDWNDYPLYVWIMQHNIESFRNFTIFNFFDTNIFYPFKGNLLFSDLFLPTSGIGFLLSFFIVNPILIFNIGFFIVLIINPIACFFFWKNFFSSKWILFFATLTSAFSPFTIINSYHFQMLNIWPFFFCLSFLLKKDLTFKNAIFGGIFLAFQFWTGVYYGIFSLFIISIWYLIKIWQIKKSRSEFQLVLKNLLIFVFIFLLLAGFFIFKYIDIKNSYNIVRDYWEYVVYAAHPSDYLFMSYHSLLLEVNLLKHWNSFNQHQSAAAFPGFVLSLLTLIGIFTYKKINQVKTIILPLNSQSIFFLILIICGFIFSLGTRLSVNGAYLNIPLPYSIVLKLVPLFEPIRADSRWVFLFFFGLTYFACLGTEKLIRLLKSKEALIVVLLSLFYVFEIIPINRNTESKQYYPSVYNLIADQCSISPKVLLEYPLTQDKKDANIVTNLTYKTQMLIASLKHKCNIVNGYSGYTPKDYERYENDLYAVVLNNDKKQFYQLLKQRHVNIFKLNKQEIYQNKAKLIENWLSDKTQFTILVDNDNYVIAKIL